MKRIRLKEIHETAWCPEFFRDSLTEFLSIVWTMNVYQKAFEKINILNQIFKADKIVDLCSGAGNYMSTLLKTIKNDRPASGITLYKTDLYPHKKFFETGEAQIKYWQEPLSAKDGFSRLDGFFCMFSALHHFDEKELLRIFFHAARSGKPFAFFDIAQRRLVRDILPNIFLPGIVWIAAPFFSKFTWKHFCFIYLIPVIPVIVSIDGTLSRMRAYRQKELIALAERVTRRYPEYCIKTGEYSLLGNMQTVTEVIGCSRVYAEKAEAAEAEWNKQKKKH